MRRPPALAGGHQKTLVVSDQERLWLFEASGGRTLRRMYMTNGEQVGFTEAPFDESHMEEGVLVTAATVAGGRVFIGRDDGW